MLKKTKHRPESSQYKVPWLSDEQSQICGKELRKLCEKERVNDIRSLRPESVWAVIEADKNHPMRAVYDFDIDKAARSHWIEQTRRIISGIRVILVSIPNRGQLEPMFYTAEAPVREQGSRVLRRTRVFRDDVFLNDPIFMSAAAGKLRRAEAAMREVEHMTVGHTMPADWQRYLAGWRELSERFHGSVEAAAE